MLYGGRGRGPVSYTHLDVYKRQAKHHAAGRGGAGTGAPPLGGVRKAFGQPGSAGDGAGGHCLSLIHILGAVLFSNEYGLLGRTASAAEMLAEWKGKKQ